MTADLPLPNGPFNQIIGVVGFGLVIQSVISVITFSRVPGAHFGGGSRAEASWAAESDVASSRMDSPKYVLV